MSMHVHQIAVHHRSIEFRCSTISLPKPAAMAAGEIRNPGDGRQHLQGGAWQIQPVRTHRPPWRDCDGRTAVAGRFFPNNVRR
ncbi:hypothetical protein ACLOJK_029136 [Asimina triloba]